MVDNSNNLLEISGNPITFSNPDPSGVLDLGFTPPPSLLNLDLSSLHPCREPPKPPSPVMSPTSALHTLIESLVRQAIEETIVEKEMDGLDGEYPEEDDSSDEEQEQNGINTNHDEEDKMNRSSVTDIVPYLDASNDGKTGPVIKGKQWRTMREVEMRKLVAEIDDYYERLGISPGSDGSPLSIEDTKRSPAVHIPPIEREIPIVKERVTIEANIRSLSDLLDLIKKYPLADNVIYNIDMAALHRIEPPLKELDAMIGMTTLKNNIVDQVLYYMQGFHRMGQGDFMHTVIYGPPGTGKTEIAKIMGRIYKDLGVLSKGKFKKATRSDLVAGYLGQTALKTRDLIKECLGGVLFIDEAYALGNEEKRDSFAKECIDTLCEALSDHKDQLMVIIAGYEHELKSCFFDYNQGLESRFTWRFKTDDYTPVELRDIFVKKIGDSGWKIENGGEIDSDFFEKNKDTFKYYGRDMETLLAKVKIRHSRRVFGLAPEHRSKITKEDIDAGFELFMSNDEVKNRVESRSTVWRNMYV